MAWEALGLISLPVSFISLPMCVACVWKLFEEKDRQISSFLVFHQEIKELSEEVKELSEEKSRNAMQIEQMKHQLETINLEHMRMARSLSARRVFEKFEDLYVNVVAKKPSTNRKQKWDEFMKSSHENAKKVSEELQHKNIVLPVSDMVTKLYRLLSDDIHSQNTDGTNKVYLVKSLLGEDLVSFMEILHRLIPLPPRTLIVFECIEDLKSDESVRELL